MGGVDGCMHGWMHAWMDACMDGCMDVYVYASEVKTGPHF